MANKHESLTSLFVAIADAIRAKTGGTSAIVADNFPSEIRNISAGGGTPEPIAITADNIEEYFEVETDGFYLNPINAFEVWGGETEGYEDENGDWVDGEIVDHGDLTLTPIKDMTFFVQLNCELEGEGAWYSVYHGDFAVFDADTSSNGLIAYMPLCLEMEVGKSLEVHVDLFTENDRATVGTMSVIPK